MNQQELINKLSEIKENVTKIDVVSDTRVYLYCEAENTVEVNKFLFRDVQARFVIATCIDSDDCFEVLYHYSYDQTGCVINLKVFVRDRGNPELESITSVVPAAEWIEREMHDLLGIKFKNHPRLERLILSDDWPEGKYPLRKEVVQ